MKKGIIFDVDGTLWDSSVQVAQSWQVAAEKLLNGPRPITPDMISRNMGKNMKDFGDALFPDLPPAKRLEVMEACMEYENQYLEDHPGILYPQVAEVLQQLSWKYKLFIVSNCQKGYIEVLMRSCNLEEYITDIECYGNTGLSKADNISMVIQRNHLDQSLLCRRYCHGRRGSCRCRNPLCPCCLWFWTGKRGRGSDPGVWGTFTAFQKAFR